MTLRATGCGVSQTSFVRKRPPRILELGLSGERELAELDHAVREHLTDPRTVVMPHLLMAAWARKAA